MKRLQGTGLIAFLALVVALATVLGGCQNQKKESATPSDKAENASPEGGKAEPAPVLTENPPSENTNPPEPETKFPAEPEQKKPAERPKPQPPREEPKPRAEAPKGPAEVTLLAGATIEASLQKELASHEAKAGDSFSLTVTEPIYVDGWVAIPAGATVVGEVVSATESGKIKGRGDITLAFKSVTDAAGGSHAIEAETFYAQAEGATDRDVATVAGGAAGGAIVGGLIGGKKGAAIGGLIGAAAGTGTVLATRGPQVKLAAGQVFAIRLTTSLSVPPGGRR